VSVVVLDTDAASSLLCRRPTDALARTLVGQVPAITFVTLGELTTWSGTGDPRPTAWATGQGNR